MEIKLKFFSDFISAFNMNDYISNYSAGRAAGEFCKIAITTFIIFILLISVSLITSESFNTVLGNIKEEFLQMKGLLLATYLIILVLGARCVFYKISLLTNVLNFTIKVMSNIGFLITATLAGVLSGMIFEEKCIIKNSISIATILNLYFFIFLLFILFYGASKAFSPKVRAFISNILEEKTGLFSLMFGIVLSALALYGLVKEPWV